MEQTELFIQYCNQKEYKRSKAYSPEHPFIHIQKFLDRSDDYKVEGGIWNWSKETSLLKVLKEKESESMDWLQLEFSTVYLRKRNKYLNEVVDRLRKLHQQVKNKEKEEAKAFQEKSVLFENHHNPLFSLLELSIIRCFHQILIEHQNNLSQINWEYLYKFFKPKEPILSFKRAGKIKDEDLEYHFKKLLLDTEIIDPKTNFRIFKNLFLQKPLSRKIEWKEAVSGLAYFITSLKDRGIIENTRNKHWKITSEFFIHNGLPVSNLKRSGKPRQDLKDTIDQFIENVHSNFEK
ncbi:hypothetical protein C7S20_05625 [Christiangramia fulva]|uniref:Uncharacterized protein n=1 Tax=Christiangramia fulva TaxID=2126553 RepID=A0A2R3Z3E1_9FLAO|nr:hypothetical protein [Christiangramia fulva]AVR44787.1 hypothetical protein C7S20_05625 [Christiangramia fulva]